MKKIRVLVIDEDILARQAVANILQKESALEIRVSGELENADELVKSLDPDIVLMNFERNNNLGISILRDLKTRNSDLPVVVLTPRTEEGAKLALYALRHGAVDIITKPEQNSLLLFAGRHLVKRLRPTIEVAAKLVNKEQTEKQVAESLKGIQHDFEEFIPKRQRKFGGSPISLVTIGACTGGPKALYSIIPGLPHDLSVPIVIVQHFPKYYTKELAQSLNELSEIQVEEAYNGVELTPGSIWIAPGGYHAEVDRDGSKTFLKLHRGPRENGVRPSIDVLFRSAGRVLGREVLGIILSGSGFDGVAGAKAIRDNGGKIVVQDPRSALASSLPLSVIKSGLADNYYPVEQIADQITKRTAPQSGNPERSDSKMKSDRDYWYADRGGLGHSNPFEM